MRVAAVLFSTALLSAGFFMLEVTWLNFAFSLVLVAVLAALWFAKYRRKPLMSDATQKTTRVHVELRGEPVTIDMVGTPKYPRTRTFAGVAIAALIPLSWWLFPDYWSSVMHDVGNRVWPLLGLLIWQLILSIYVLFRAPERSSRVLSGNGISPT